MYLQGKPRGDQYTFWHPGYAWAARREIYDNLGGLLDTAILGAADHHMALAMIGDAKFSMPGGISKGYSNDVYRWQELCDLYLRRDIGFVDGTLLHAWHGPKGGKDKAGRRYQERWEILVKNQYNPADDLKRDWQGLYQLEVHEERQIKLRDDIRAYFRQRNEDSITID